MKLSVDVSTKRGSTFDLNTRVHSAHNRDRQSHAGWNAGSFYGSRRQQVGSSAPMMEKLAMTIGWPGRRPMTTRIGMVGNGYGGRIATFHKVPEAEEAFAGLMPCLRDQCTKLSSWAVVA
jgi:hypothetical protein